LLTTLERFHEFLIGNAVAGVDNWHGSSKQAELYLSQADNPRYVNDSHGTPNNMDKHILDPRLCRCAKLTPGAPDSMIVFNGLLRASNSSSVPQAFRENVKHVDVNSCGSHLVPGILSNECCMTAAEPCEVAYMSISYGWKDLHQSNIPNKAVAKKYCYLRYDKDDFQRRQGMYGYYDL
jgi:hypothetical protein